MWSICPSAGLREGSHEHMKSAKESRKAGNLKQGQQGKTFKDYEPEQKYGTAHDIQEHIRYGGTREDY